LRSGDREAAAASNAGAQHDQADDGRHRKCVAVTVRDLLEYSGVIGSQEVTDAGPFREEVVGLPTVLLLPSINPTETAQACSIDCKSKRSSSPLPFAPKAHGSNHSKLG
jgi:hypothetical protein